MTVLEFKQRETKTRKQCSCSRWVILDKAKAKKNNLGYWQNCTCGSTLVFKDADDKKEKRKADKKANNDGILQRILKKLPKKKQQE